MCEVSSTLCHANLNETSTKWLILDRVVLLKGTQIRYTCHLSSFSFTQCAIGSQGATIHVHRQCLALRKLAFLAEV